jgi:5-methylthioadenosine/S-adenosylhomocysteine deaminase
VVHTHVNENRDQADLVAGDNDARDVELLHRLGALGPRTVLAHCVWLDPREVAHLARTGTTVAHCPTANLKLGSGIADVPRLLDAGVNVGLGTDGAACNNSLDVLQELRLAALVHRVRGGPGAMPADRALRLATVNGARALGLGPLGGSLAPGAPADVVVLSAPEVTGAAAAHLAEAHVVHTATGADVRTVVVAGRVVVEHGELLTGSLPDIRREALAARETLLERTGVLGAAAAAR